MKNFMRPWNLSNILLKNNSKKKRQLVLRGIPAVQHVEVIMMISNMFWTLFI